MKSIHSPTQAVPLWKQLQATAKVVQQVAAGKSGSVAIEGVEASLRPGVQALAFYVWRNWGRAEALRKALVSKKPAAEVNALLCTALALAWQEVGALYDSHTLVNQAVEAAKRNSKTKAQANFINACLRRFLRDRVALIQQTDKNLSALYNHPVWWIQHLQRQYPEQWQDILAASNLQAPMTLRVNQRKMTVSQYLQTLQEANIGATHKSGHTVFLNQALPVQRIPGFAEGLPLGGSAAPVAACAGGQYARRSG